MQQMRENWERTEITSSNFSNHYTLGENPSWINFYIFILICDCVSAIWRKFWLMKCKLQKYNWKKLVKWKKRYALFFEYYSDMIWRVSSNQSAEVWNALCLRPWCNICFAAWGPVWGREGREARLRLLRPPPPQARPLRGGERLLAATGGVYGRRLLLLLLIDASFFSVLEVNHS